MEQQHQIDKTFLIRHDPIHPKYIKNNGIIILRVIMLIVYKVYTIP